MSEHDVTVNLSELTYRERIEAARAADLKAVDADTLASALIIGGSFAWVVERRANPALTFDDWLDTFTGAVNIVDEPGEAKRANNGASPQVSPESGA